MPPIIQHGDSLHYPRMGTRPAMMATTAIIFGWTRSTAPSMMTVSTLGAAGRRRWRPRLRLANELRDPPRSSGRFRRERCLSASGIPDRSSAPHFSMSAKLFRHSRPRIVRLDGVAHGAYGMPYARSRVGSSTIENCFTLPPTLGRGTVESRAPIFMAAIVSPGRSVWKVNELTADARAFACAELAAGVVTSLFEIRTIMHHARQ
jgi:hypothetical protein